jgi:outer membrane protein assembly factor BamA
MSKKILYKYKILVIGIMLFFGCVSYAQKDSAKSKHILAFPVIAKSIETGWSFGAAALSTFHLSKADTATRTSNIQSLVLYSLKKQFVAAINGAEYFYREKYILNEQFSYSSFPDKFWGLGKYSRDREAENYDFQQFYINLHLLKHLGNNFFAGLLFEFQDLMKIRYNPGGMFDQQNVVGRNPYIVSGLGLSFTYDKRNDAFAPDKGTFAQFYFNHFDSYLGSDYKYTNLVLDYRKFIRLYKKNVLALQAYSFTNLGDSIPLRSLASLGGANSMRGYYAGRFRDKQQLVFQSEYRMPVYKRFGAVVFYSMGDVGNTPTDFSFTDLKYSFGGGLRFALNKSEKMNLRLDYGIGQGNNSGLYFQLGEAF